MKKWILATSLITASLFAGEASKVGIVNFATCATDSKYGRQEQASFESLRKQMVSLMEDTEKQLKEIAAKFNDKDYMDGLSPEAETELKTKMQTLNDELGRYQQQYYQVMNQAHSKVIQAIATNINNASEKVAADKHLNLVVNKELCFYYTPALDITTDVIKEMDKSFETANPQAAAEASK